LVSGWGWHAAVVARRRAETAEELAERGRAETAKAKEAADARARESDGLFKFLRDVLTAVEPRALGRDVKVADMLDVASAKVDSREPSQRGVQAVLNEALGAAYRVLGRYPKAEPRYRASLAARRDMAGADEHGVLAATNDLAELLAEKGDAEEAE